MHHNRYRACVYNIQNGGRSNDRLLHQIDLLKSLRADIICLPECTFWNDNDEYDLLWAANSLKMNVASFAQSYVGDGRNYTTLLYRPSAFQLIGRRLMDPSLFHHAMIRARLRPVGVRGDNYDIFVFATHLSPFNGEKRLEEVRRITDFGGSFPGAPNYSLLLGDLNIPDREPVSWSHIPANLHSRYRLVNPDGSFGGVDQRALRILLESGWQDPQELLGYRREPTVGYYYDNERVPWCLDYCLSRGLFPWAYETYDGPMEKKMLSDHLPIWFDFGFQPILKKREREMA